MHIDNSVVMAREKGDLPLGGEEPGGRDGDVEICNSVNNKNKG